MHPSRLLVKHKKNHSIHFSSKRTAAVTNQNIFRISYKKTIIKWMSCLFMVVGASYERTKASSLKTAVSPSPVHRTIKYIFGKRYSWNFSKAKSSFTNKNIFPFKIICGNYCKTVGGLKDFKLVKKTCQKNAFWKLASGRKFGGLVCGQW